MTEGRNEKPGGKSGVAHLAASAGYSAAGARRLWREAAFRQELLAGLVVVGLFVWAGAAPGEYLGLAVLALMLFAVEALNTAVEELVDHVSPGWADFAKNAKDLGSFAVFCLLLATGIYAAAVIFT